MCLLIFPILGVRHDRRSRGFCLRGRRRRRGGDSRGRVLSSFRLRQRMNHITIRILHRIAIRVSLDLVIVRGIWLYICGDKNRILNFCRRSGRGDGLGYTAILIGCGR